ncbi:unnamed protein product [Vicia faba]|uniref:Uncharacterized protein n=1 Tax=Vicia faba TaxID=3906 RepID=A0AAV0YRG2_VICFA|nr:unnamed protein product [Vicia faba]
MLNFNNSSISIVIQFKFKYKWTTHPLYLDIVKSSWKSKVVGCPMFVLSEKLRLLKNNLKSWNKNTFGNSHHLVDEEVEKLTYVQGKIQVDGYTEALRSEEKLCMSRLEDALHKEHLF